MPGVSQWRDAGLQAISSGLITYLLLTTLAAPRPLPKLRVWGAPDQPAATTATLPAPTELVASERVG